MQGYLCYWHGGKGYSGVALHVSKAFSPERPVFSHPSFDHENRIVAARIVREIIKLSFLIERKYAPYSKWLGSAFVRLRIAGQLSPILNRV